MRESLAMKEVLAPLLDNIRPGDPPDKVITITVAAARSIIIAFLPKFQQVAASPFDREWINVGDLYMWRQSARAKRIWTVAKLNATPRDLRIRAGTDFGVMCRFEDFAYIYDENEYIHLPTRRALNARQVNRLFPPDTHPSLAGSPRLPSNFIRRHNRFMTRADFLNVGKT